MSHIRYIAVIRKEENTDYWVDIPDIPGCVAGGETPEEAMKHFAEALTAHLKALEPSSLRSPRTLGEILTAEGFPHPQTYMVEIETASAGWVVRSRGLN